MDKSIIKFSAMVYVAAFIVLIGLYLYFVISPGQEDYNMFFNIRRFLIQPLFLLLLLQAKIGVNHLINASQEAVKLSV